MSLRRSKSPNDERSNLKLRGRRPRRVSNCAFENCDDDRGRHCGALLCFNMYRNVLWAGVVFASALSSVTLYTGDNAQKTFPLQASMNKFQTELGGQKGRALASVSTRLSLGASLAKLESFHICACHLHSRHAGVLFAVCCHCIAPLILSCIVPLGLVTVGETTLILVRACT